MRFAPNDVAPDMADRLAKSLRLAGVGVAEMAQWLEKSPNTVGTWLRGTAKPDPANLKMWAIRTGVPSEWLETGIWPEGWPGNPDDLMNHVNQA